MRTHSATIPTISQYCRANSPQASYFFTVVSYRQQRILCLPEVREALRAAIQTTRQQHPFEIVAWVLLPDHLHTIWTLPEGDADFSTRWSLIKRRVSQPCPALHSMDQHQQSQATRTHDLAAPVLGAPNP